MAIKFTFPEIKLQTPDMLSTRLTSNLDSSWVNSFNLPSLSKLGDTLPSSIRDSWSYKSWKLKNDWDNSMKDINKQWENPSLQQGQNIQQQSGNVGNQLASAGISAVGSQLSGMFTDGIFGDSDIGRGMSNIFSSGISAATDTMANNIIKGTSLTQGLGQNVGQSIQGAALGTGANLVGKGINALGEILNFLEVQDKVQQQDQLMLLEYIME